MFFIKQNQAQAQINEQIRDKEIRLIDAKGQMVGVVSSREAQKIAVESELDLVKISPNANPPVCKIMDYGKYLYEQNKKLKEAKKKQVTVSIKEVRLSPKIEEHDFSFKVKNATKFLKTGDKVKVSIRFRGREMQYTSLGTEVLGKFSEAVKEYGTVDRKPKMEGRSMTMILTPIKK